MKRSLFAIVLIFVAFAIAAQERIDTPELVKPTDTDDDQMPNVTLDWNAVSTALNYQVQLSEDAGFTNLIIDSVTDLTSVKTNLLTFGQEYYWRVKAYDLSGGSSFWTPTWSFTTFSQIDLSKPNTGSNEEEPDVTLKWKNTVSGSVITGVYYFDVQIDITESFDSPQFAEFTTDGTTYLKAMDQLLFGTTYYWRARARHTADESEWSDVRNFETLFLFDLKKPNDGSSDQDLNVLLRWDDISGIKKFDYQVDDDPDFGSPNTYVTDTFRVKAEELKFGITYYWRARGRHDFDTTLWAEPYNFTTAATVVLEEPENGADSISLKPQFVWSQIEGVNNYEVSYAMDETFADAFVDFKEADDDTNPFYNIIYKLEAGTTYYWRIRACTPTDTSDYSQVFSFTTIPGVGIEDVYFNNAGISIFPNPANTDVNIQMNITEPANIEFTLIDLVGQTLIARELIFTPGMNNEKVDLSNLSNGIYLLKMKKGNSIYTNKLIINK
jgi:hypothetical protein